MYTLGSPASSLTPSGPVASRPITVEVRRVAVPDFLDSQDIVLRNGNRLDRSTTGRWASRLSVGVTRFVTARLAGRWPNAVVTDQSQVEAPSYRIYITITALNVDVNGSATLEADWLVVPHDPARPTRRGRGRFTAAGPVRSDQQVVSLTETVMQKLADAINVPGLDAGSTDDRRSRIGR